MTKIEQVARALDPAIFQCRDDMYAYCIRQGDSEEEALATVEWAHPLGKAFDRARAAIEAMPAPTPKMLEAGCNAANECDPSGTGWVPEEVSHIFRAMIDAALAEDQQC